MERDWLIVAERWAAYPQIPAYEVSDRGRVRRGGRILAQRVGAKTGYPMVTLSLGGRSIGRTVHSMVAEAFIGPRPPEHEVSHQDGVRANPRLGNLRYETKAQNHARRRAHGTNGAGEKNPAAKLTNAKVVDIKRRLALGERQADLAREFGVTRQVVWFIDHSYTWKEAA